MPKKKRADVPAIRSQFDPSSNDAVDPDHDPFDPRLRPVRRGPAWELAVIEAAVEEMDREDADHRRPSN
ncbi:hypothetical protein LK09_03150 [Microbacterium mangrovi]|uniref:Uncharacterized protein n=1 Tax=Microbacterium mangrovi TaxID=1348253 RepID=A0A0B2A894_9MICO|nr:hypothetical protein [Microbacterium mangrovi]KHK99300.1 hypothetical protein LK09_03150 [Microbacterium mangrovi]